MANHFDQREQVQNNGEHNPRKNKAGVITSYTIRVYHGYGRTANGLNLIQ